MTEKPKRGAPTGNRNSAKDGENRSSQLFIRCTPAQKAAWVRAAGGRKLSDWVIQQLNSALQRCERCDYPMGEDWLDGGQTCPKCLLVN